MQPDSKSISTVGKLQIVALEISSLWFEYEAAHFALVCTIENGLPQQFHQLVRNNRIFIHSHKHPRCVLTALLHPDVPHGCVMMNEIQCVNSKVCIGEIEDWTIYKCESFQYDAREGVVGDTEIRYADNPVQSLKDITVSIRARHKNENDSNLLAIDAKDLSSKISKMLFGGIISNDELFQIHTAELGISNHASDNGSAKANRIICRVVELNAEETADQVDEEHDFMINECHRGAYEADTVLYCSELCCSFATGMYAVYICISSHF